MAEEIGIEVGDSFVDRHESLLEQVGEPYAQRMREKLEDEIHQFTKELERMSEQEQNREL